MKSPDVDNGADVVPLDEADNVEDGKVTAATPDEEGVDEDDDTAQRRRRHLP